MTIEAKAEFENRWIGANNSSQAIGLLFDFMKTENAKFSLAEVCNKAKIPSRGYLVSVMKSRRTLHPKYRNTITKGFGLRGTSAKFLKALIDLDHEKQESRKYLLNRKLDRYRKSLSYKRPIMPGELPNLPMAVEVFAAFGLFGNRAMEEDIVKYFGPQSARSVVTALDALLEYGLIRVDGLHYQIVRENVMFSGSDNGLTHLEFLKKGLTQSRKAVDTWFTHPHLSHFESSILSVSKSQLINLLPNLKSHLNETRSHLETSEGDMLIQFAVQVFPVGCETHST